MTRVSGKIALVTGAARGLGAAIATRLAAEGATVYMTDLLEEQGAKVAAETGATFLRQDVSSEAGWAELAARIEAEQGRLDILVNNAGLVRINSLEDATLDELRLQQQVILEGTFLGCKAMLPLLRKAPVGSIINITALAAMRAVGAIPAYSGVKAAIHGMSRSMAQDFKTRGYPIRVNCIAPGAHDTPMMRMGDDFKANDPAMEKTIAAGIGQPEDVANLALFFASDESRQINGQIVVIDNGASLP